MGNLAVYLPIHSFSTIVPNGGLRIHFSAYFWQVGDEIVEINGEPAHGISHTRAIDLIQAGGSKVVLLLRPGAGLAQEGSKSRLNSNFSWQTSVSDDCVESWF